jgi:hypothetical protein
MGAKGNKFWEIRSSHGRKPIFEDSEVLWTACCEYFQWANENPLQEDKLFAFQGSVTRDSVDLMRPFTLGGLCIFLDISDDTWRNYRAKDDFIGVITQVEAIIYNQKFSGAATGLLNANIIARDLGLRESTESVVEVTHSLNKLTDEELDKHIEELIGDKDD